MLIFAQGAYMTKRSLQKKVALLNDYITKELEREIKTEVTEIEREHNTAKNEKKFMRPYFTRNHYFT
jgi:hypothetical protein